MKKMLIPFGIITSLLFGTAASAQTTFEMTIVFPYAGHNNEWTITFTNRNYPYDSYQFITTNQQYPWGVPSQSGILGTLPEGSFDVEFASSYYSPDYFDYFMAEDYTPGPGNTTIYNVTLTAADNYLIIDKF